jgi:hypothetical protein
VVDVRDDAEIAYELWVHSCPLPPGFFLRVFLSARRRALLPDEGRSSCSKACRVNI